MDDIEEVFPIRTMQEIHDEHMRIIDEFGFMGDEDTPVEVEVKNDGYGNMPRLYKDDKPVHVIVRYALQHVHSTDGKCLKSRWGLCKKDVV